MEKRPRVYTWKEVDTEGDEIWKVEVKGKRVAVCPRKSGWEITEVRLRRNVDDGEADKIVVTIKKR